VGNNGTGKTNLLDAIHYLSFCKSYFNLIDTQNIRHDEPFFAVHGDYIKNDDRTETISCLQQRAQKKVFKINKKPYTRLADHIGLFPLVMVSPYDRDLINDGSEIRRKYIDSVISQFDKIYLDDLINYNKALLQRNTLLKLFYDSRSFDKASLEIWDEQMITLGDNIFQKRKKFVTDFIAIFQEYFEFITNGKEKVNILYESQLEKQDYKILLEQSIERDMALCFTSAGIHKDDLIFMLDDYPIKKYGSQGQQKSFVIALKLAQFDYTKDVKGFKPILLFDDIFDKLDESRVKQIVRLVGNNSFGQVFLTDTDRDRINKIFQGLDISYRLFQVLDGQVTLIKQEE
jgi:DNA replication and repair protein RecF